jgi:hypothetical protein
MTARLVTQMPCAFPYPAMHKPAQQLGADGMDVPRVCNFKMSLLKGSIALATGELRTPRTTYVLIRTSQVAAAPTF